MFVGACLPLLKPLWQRLPERHLPDGGFHISPAPPFLRICAAPTFSPPTIA